MGVEFKQLSIDVIEPTVANKEVCIPNEYFY